MDFKGKKCPVCEIEFKENDDIVVCPKCGAPYHRECYKVKNKCIFPELHKEKKSWKSVYCPEDIPDENDQTDEPAEDDENTVVCKHCGHKNSKDSIVCEQCGDFLTGPVIFNPFGDNNSDSTENDEEELEKIKEQMRNVGPVMGSANFYVNGTSPFSFGIDENEDHDGVTSKELVDYVGGNSLYYLPIFSKIKRFNTSRFNFAAFIFNGVWYFYRKQYVKGILISLVSLLLNVFQGIVNIFWAGALWERANNELAASENLPTYLEYINWMRNNCSLQEQLIMLLPYLLSFLSLVIMVVCGLTANRGYYKKAIKSIKKIKAENPDLQQEKLRNKIIRKGGVHLGAAFCLITCESILRMAIMYFFS